LKTKDQLVERAGAFARRLWRLTTILTILLVAATFFYTDINKHAYIYVGIIILILFGALFLVGYFTNRNKNGWAFGMMGLYIALVLASCFWIIDV
jgi:cytochrome bd ubiquinol oxidase subunit II